MSTLGIIFLAAGIGCIFIAVLVTVLDDGSIRDDECHCDYMGGECDKCYAERRDSWDNNATD